MATITSTIDGETVRWRDKKRYLYPLSLVIPLLPFLAWDGATRTGPVSYTHLTLPTIA